MTHKFQSWESVPLEEMSDLISRKIITGEKAMVAQVFLKKDAVVPEHQHESEQITYILEGALKFDIEGREVIVRKGEVRLSLRTCRIARLRSKTRWTWIFSRRSGPTGWRKTILPAPRRTREDMTMDLGIRGRVALVAASSQGLGKASLSVWRGKA